MTPLSEEELTALDRLLDGKRQVKARASLVAEGERPDRVHILLDGWACRFKLLDDGRRQITALLVPGDLCDLDALYLRESDFAVATLTSCTVVPVSRTALRDLAARNPGIADALGWLGAVENAMLAERNACLGRRSAREHLAHLLCELLVRLTVVGRARSNGFTLPITQEEIADALGLTAVHVNRVLQSLRADGLIEQRGPDLVVADWNALQKTGAFQPDYIHLEGLDGDGRGMSAAPWAFPAQRRQGSPDRPHV